MKKEEEIKEEKKEEIKDAKVVEDKKKKKNNGIYFLICIILLMIFVALVIALNNVGLINFDNIKLNPKNDITLNYTTTNNKQKEGVYVTDVSEVVEEVMPSIVAITSKTLVNSGRFGPFFFGGESYAQGAGSGIIVGQTENEILILTNYHVVEGASELSVQFVDEKSVDASVKGTAQDMDVAVIAVDISKVEKDTLSSVKIATIGDSTALKVGNGIIAIGNALGYGQSVTTGVVSALNRDVTIDELTIKMIQIDAAINGGNSGGALLNSAGEVVGINSAKYSSSGYSSEASIEGMGFAIPISDVKDLIEEMMNGKNVVNEPAQIGIVGDIISGGSGSGVPTGFYISQIEPGSGAEEAGLEVGWVITKINNKNVTSINVIKNEIKNKKKGDKVTLVVSYPNKNSYKEKEVEVTLS